MTVKCEISEPRLSIDLKKIIFQTGELKVDCHFDVSNGVVLIQGKNGVGKTSILEAIVGMREFKGTCELDGVEIETFKSDQKKVLSYCPAKYLFADSLTGNAYLRFVAKCYGVPSSSLYSNALSLGMSNSTLEDEIKHLSYGSVKKLLIAASLCDSAEVILMDEPFNGLDEHGKHFLLDYILKNYKNRIFIVVSHEAKSLVQFDPIQIYLA